MPREVGATWDLSSMGGVSGQGQIGRGTGLRLLTAYPLF